MLKRGLKIIATILPLLVLVAWMMVAWTADDDDGRENAPVFLVTEKQLRVKIQEFADSRKLKLTEADMQSVLSKVVSLSRDVLYIDVREYLKKIGKLRDDAEWLDAPSSTPVLEAKILEINDKLKNTKISIGSEDGVKPLALFYAYRGDEIIGLLIAQEVGMAETDCSLWLLSGNLEAKIGDDVTTHISYENGSEKFQQALWELNVSSGFVQGRIQYYVNAMATEAVQKDEIGKLMQQVTDHILKEVDSLIESSVSELSQK